MKEIMIQDGLHFVDVGRIRRNPETGNLKLETIEFLKFARRGQVAAVPGFVSSVAGLFRAVRSLGWAGIKPSLTGRIGRSWRMVWRGCWVVSWESGKTRVFWKAGEV